MDTAMSVAIEWTGMDMSTTVWPEGVPEIDELNRTVYQVTASPVDFPTLILKRSSDDLLNFGNSFKWPLSSNFEAH